MSIFFLVGVRCVDRNLFQGQIWVVRADGRRYRKKIYGSTKREVLKKLRVLRQEQELGSFLPVEEETVGDYLLRCNMGSE